MFLKYLYVAFVILCPTVIGASKTPFAFDVSNMKCRSRNNHLKLFECGSTETAPGQFVLNYRIMADQNFGKDIELHLKLLLKPLKGNRTVTYLDLKVSLCAATSQLFNNALLRGFMEEIRRTSNFEYECPYKGNFLYKVENYTLMNQVIPSFAPSVNCTFTLYAFKKGQLLADYILESSFIRGDDIRRNH